MEDFNLIISADTVCQHFLTFEKLSPITILIYNENKKLSSEDKYWMWRENNDKVNPIYLDSSLKNSKEEADYITRLVFLYLSISEK